MPALDWSRYRAVSGQADEADASRLCDSRDPVDRAMGEALALDHARFVPEPWADEPLPWWVSFIGGVVWAWIILGGIAVALGALWLLMWHVLPLVPWSAALLIQTGGQIVAGVL